MSAILLLACVAMLAGARGESAIADWAQNYGAEWRTRLGFTHPTGPSRSTLHRVFARIPVALLEARLAAWAQQVVAALAHAAAEPSPLAGVAMDGETLRMSRRCGATDCHLLSLFSHRGGMVLGEVAVNDRTNEITASTDALALRTLTGVVLTGDALLTQQRIARTILDGGNDYLPVVKANRPALHAETAVLFADPAATVATAETPTRHGQRREHRRVRASAELTGHTRRPGLAQVLCLERCVTDLRAGITTTERAYAATSLARHRAAPLQPPTLWRERVPSGRVHIENRLH